MYSAMKCYFRLDINLLVGHINLRKYLQQSLIVLLLLILFKVRKFKV